MRQRKRIRQAIRKRQAVELPRLKLTLMHESKVAEPPTALVAASTAGKPCLT
ncbi:unnamed protein product [Dovyalis caffra]|uniref:Ribosomal protein S14 n=1 Tax=Dovyalis caffra TaxID=77055 RepID=A0AAV1RHY1_9ROSI|nr:unnamed protein product [Dovyalis caffra]